MPIPKPKDNEQKNVFITRCMADKTMNKEFKDQKKRAGVCYSQWKKKQETELRKGIQKKGDMLILNSFKQLKVLLEAQGDNQPVTPVPGKKESKSAFMGRCMRSLKSRKSKEVKPAVMKARCTASWAKAHGGDNMSDKFHVGAVVIQEAFFSLGHELRQAIKKQTTGKTYLEDFSSTEVVYVKYSEDGGEDVYYKMSYEVENGEVSLIGSPELVDRKVTYEKELPISDLVDLTEMELAVKR